MLTYLYVIYCKHTLNSVLTFPSDFMPSKQCTVYSNAEFLMEIFFSGLGYDSLKLVVPPPLHWSQNYGFKTIFLHFGLLL